MKKSLRNSDRIATILLFAVLPVFLMGYTEYSPSNMDNGCEQCHGDFQQSGNDDLHGLHVSAMTGECGLCHQSSIGDPVLLGESEVGGGSLGCNGCHKGVGLRAKHGSNQDGAGRTCTSACHSGDGIPDAESETPPYYARGDVNINAACFPYMNAGGEDYDGDGLGLDNDGDGDYDLDDADCFGTPNIEQSWSSVKVQFDD